MIAHRTGCWVAGASARRQAGFSMFGILFVAFMVAMVALMAIKILPTANEFFTIKRAIKAVASSGATTAAQARIEFEKRRQIEYSINTITAADLEIVQRGDGVDISFAYEKEIELFDPFFLLIKYHGSSR